MSDAVWVAFWSGLWTNLGAIITAAVAGGVTVYMTWRNGQRAEAAKTVALETKEELKAEVCAIKDHLSTVSMRAVRSQEEVAMARQSGVRSGYVDGIEEGKRQSTGPASL